MTSESFGADSPADSSSELEEVTVTAQKRSESIMSVPISVTAFGADAVKDLQIRQPADLAGHVAGLQLTNPGGDANPIFSLRGISMNDYSFNQTGPIAIYKDEVFNNGTIYMADQTFDIQRIEVLRGPQGTLYGRNATGGAINFVTVKPDFTTNGYVTAGIGNYRRYEVESAFQSTLSDSLAYRIAANYVHADGYEKNSLNSDTYGGTKEFGVRLTLVYKPSDALEATLRISGAMYGPSPFALATSGDGAYGYLGGAYPFYQVFPAIPAVPAGFDPFGSYGRLNGRNSRTAAVDIGAYGPSTDIRRTGDAALNLVAHATPTLDIVSITSFGRGEARVQEDADQSPLQLMSDGGNTDGHEWAQDLRLVSTGGSAFKYIVGAYIGEDFLRTFYHYPYFTDVDFNGDGVINYQDCEFTLANGLAPYGCIQSNHFNQKRTSYAGYADGTLALNDVFSLRAGIRYTRDKLQVNDYNAQILGADGVPILNTIPGSTADFNAVAPPLSNTWSKTTGRLGLDAQLPGGPLLYATFSPGYRGGSVNAQAYNGLDELTVARPETLTAGELGIKGTAFEKRLMFTAAGFYYRYKEQQAINIDPTNFHQTEVNLGRSHLYGADMDLTAQVLDTLRIGANASFLRTKVDEAIVSGVDLAGKEAVLAPKFSGGIYIDWTALQSTSGALKLFVEESYVGKQWDDLFETPSNALAARALTNGRLTYAFNQQPLSISLWGKNLLNKYYFAESYDLSSFGFQYHHPGAPRTYGLEVNYKFQ